MLVSIAVPSFNYGRFIESCLSSIRAQTYVDFEVLIADGGSTDNSIEIINRFCEEDARFRLVSLNDNGQSDAIDKAFQIAKGDIYCYLNSDDLFLCSDAISFVVETFSLYPNTHLVSCEGYYVNAVGKYLKPVKLRYHPLDGIGWMKYRTAVLQPATFWRREVYQTFPFDKNLHFAFDVFFFYQAYCRYSWITLPKIVAGYRLHEENKSLTVRPERVLELVKFEQFKFGDRSLRFGYLIMIYWLLKIVIRIPALGRFFARLIYFVVNSISFLTAYRLPGI